MSSLTAAMIALTGITAIPVLTLVMEILAATLAARKHYSPPSSRKSSVAVLVPAHDESGNVVRTCQALTVELLPGDRLIVIADNCSDDTASLARSTGAEVIERHDPTRRGKGHALAYAREHLCVSPPDVIVVVDADCQMSPGGINLLAMHCLQFRRPAQAAYYMKNNEAAPILMRIAEFASLVKCVVRPLGSLRLGWPCQLMGTGMAIPWRLFAEYQDATGHIVEDLKLGLDLARAGSPPLFVPEVQVISRFPETIAGARSQRTRWEHGHLGVILTEGPRVAWQAIASRRLDLLTMALDLLVPPLSLLVGWLALLVIAVTGAALSNGEMPALLAVLSLAAVLVLAMAWTWWRYGRSILTAKEVAFIPFYALAKLPIYAGFLLKRQKDWVRTDRKGGNA